MKFIQFFPELLDEMPSEVRDNAIINNQLIVVGKILYSFIVIDHTKYKVLPIL